MAQLLVLLLVAYVIGATPTSYWVGRFVYDTDLRREGSGNLGATNTFRVLGWKAALPVLVVDVLKGWLPVWWLPRLAPELGLDWALAFGAAAIVGHVFSFWVGFRGGKGVATSAGVLIALAPMAMAAALAAWAVVLAITRMVSAGSMAAAVTAPLWAAFTPGVRPALLTFLSLLGCFILWAHRSNIGRILRGEEPRVGPARKAAAS